MFQKVNNIDWWCNLHKTFWSLIHSQLRCSYYIKMLFQQGLAWIKNGEQEMNMLEDSPVT